ncbi:hypothetical protein [Xanthocytophaga agilis]|uniref:Uncharacterized protein n=1 Tax=Xanthocytophaga agilis TaxID=3048010 RepID=A0AAE3UF02_9BACT|nr:hypothetical protein [Xanthocytophaga agilis]MDJ1501886.1 hypothetical protein [Xanthocytophaga agilis]
MKTIDKLSQKSLALRYKLVQLDLQINRLQGRVKELEDEEHFCLADLDFLKIYIKQLEQLIIENPDPQHIYDQPIHKQIAQARNKWNRTKTKLAEIHKRQQNMSSIKLLAKLFLRDQAQTQLDQIQALIRQMEKKKRSL